MSGFNDLFGVSDTLDAVLLGFFFFGLVFVVLTLLAGFADVGLGGHDVGGHDLAGHALGGHVHTGQPHAGHADHGADNQGFLAYLNIGSVLAFVMWFGGTTYLFKNAIGLPSLLALALGVGGGLAGGWAIFSFMRFMKSNETFYSATDERLGGSVAQVTSSIRPGGTGEIVYELHGVRQVSAARALNGGQIPRGSDVIVLRRENGIAYVEPWKALTDADEWEERFQLAGSTGTGEPPPRSPA